MRKVIWSMRPLLAAVIPAAILLVSVAQAQQAPPVRIRGTIEAVAARLQLPETFARWITAFASTPQWRS